jgi:hypothetical protein
MSPATEGRPGEDAMKLQSSARPLPIRIVNHNQTVVRTPSGKPQHNQTLIRVADVWPQHNQTIVRAPYIHPQHNQTLIRR